MRCSHEVWDASTAGSSCAGALLLNRLDDTQPIAPAACERASSRWIGTRRAVPVRRPAHAARGYGMQQQTVREVRDSVGRRGGDGEETLQLGARAPMKSCVLAPRHATSARAVSLASRVHASFCLSPWLEAPGARPRSL